VATEYASFALSKMVWVSKEISSSSCATARAEKRSVNNKKRLVYRLYTLTAKFELDQSKWIQIK